LLVAGCWYEGNGIYDNQQLYKTIIYLNLGMQYTTSRVFKNIPTDCIFALNKTISMVPQGFTTKVIHAGFAKTDAHHALQMPIYSNAAFDFESAEEMEDAFMGRRPDHTYSRISNPTVENFENRIRTVTGALGVTALSSGMAAISNTFFAIAQTGSNIVTSSHLFGNTYSFFTITLRAFGVETRFCDLTNPEEVEKNIDHNSVAIFFETITNPQLEIVDIKKLASIAKKHQVPLIADSTLTPPNIFRGSDFGINIEVISSTKIISGGATSIGGLILDYGTFDWTQNKKLAESTRKFGPFAFNAKIRKEIQRNLGACLSPYHAYLQSMGLETLALRYEKAGTNCLQMAEYLQKESRIKKVSYPGLKTSGFHELGVKQFGNYPGAMLTFNFETRGDCFAFMNKLKIIRRATNLYDNKSLIIHPASTIYGDFSPETREAIDVPDTLLRLSAGIEDINDLLEDIHSALNTEH
jgi:O-acetylhomoserine (thiol)-lyase